MRRRLLFLISLCFVPIVTASVSAELVGHWKLDEGSGATTADASGKGNHGTLIDNPTWITGINGGALEFHGSGVAAGGGPYFWRVDEVNNDGTVTRGRIWSFTVADYLVVDDFESYNDIEEGLTVGVQGAGAIGTLLLDDIALYR